MSSPDDKFDDLSILFISKGDPNVPESKKMDVNDKLRAKSLDDNYEIFSTLEKSKHSKWKVLSIFAVGALMLSGIFVAIKLQTNNVATQDTNASECNEFQIRINENGNSYCKDCPIWEYGDLSSCQKDSPTGKCKKTESGCYGFIWNSP